MAVNSIVEWSTHHVYIQPHRMLASCCPKLEGREIYYFLQDMDKEEEETILREEKQLKNKIVEIIGNRKKRLAEKVNKISEQIAHLNRALFYFYPIEQEQLKDAMEYFKEGMKMHEYKN